MTNKDFIIDWNNNFGLHLRKATIYLGSINYPCIATWQQLQLLSFFLNNDKVNLIGYINVATPDTRLVERLNNKFNKLIINNISTENSNIIIFKRNPLLANALVEKYPDYFFDFNKQEDNFIIFKDGTKYKDAVGNEITDTVYGSYKNIIKELNVTGITISNVINNIYSNLLDFEYLPATKKLSFSLAPNVYICGFKWVELGSTSFNLIQRLVLPSITSFLCVTTNFCLVIDFGPNLVDTRSPFTSTVRPINIVFRSSQLLTNGFAVGSKYSFVDPKIYNLYIESYLDQAYIDKIKPIGGTEWLDAFSVPITYDEVDPYWNDYEADPLVQQLIAREVELDNQFELFTQEQSDILKQTISKIGKLGAASPYANLSRRERLWYLERFPLLYCDWEDPESVPEEGD